MQTTIKNLDNRAIGFIIFHRNNTLNEVKNVNDSELTKKIKELFKGFIDVPSPEVWW